MTDDELQPNFFTPDFLRPVPEPELSDEENGIEDDDMGYWLTPGLVPEPYWDINMG